MNESQLEHFDSLKRTSLKLVVAFIIGIIGTIVFCWKTEFLIAWLLFCTVFVLILVTLLRFEPKWIAFNRFEIIVHYWFFRTQKEQLRNIEKIAMEDDKTLYICWHKKSLPIAVIFDKNAQVRLISYWRSEKGLKLD